MRRRLGLIVVFGLQVTACAGLDGAGAEWVDAGGLSSAIEAPAPVEGYDWHLTRHDGESSLAYGLAESDDLRLALTCMDGSGRLSMMRDADEGARAEIYLESGGETERYAAASEPSMMTGGVILTAQASASEPLFQRFRRVGWLAAWQDGTREAYAPHAQSADNIEAFFEACGQG